MFYAGSLALDPNVRNDVPVSAATVSQGRIRAARAWFGGIAVVIAAALIIQIILIINGGADANSGESGTTVSLPIRFVRLFSYFTIESNIVVLVISVLLAANPLRTGRLWEVARLNALLAITITGLVYDIILAPLVHLTGWALAATIGFHYIAPWATVLGWLIFGPRPRLKWWMIPAPSSCPIAWLIYIFTQGRLHPVVPVSVPQRDESRVLAGAAELPARGRGRRRPRSDLQAHRLETARAAPRPFPPVDRDRRGASGPPRGPPRTNPAKWGMRGRHCGTTFGSLVGVQRCAGLTQEARMPICCPNKVARSFRDCEAHTPRLRRAAAPVR